MSEPIASNSDEVRGMLQRAVQALSPDARELVADFILSEYDVQGGGFGGRDNASDLYYTSFGLSCAAALGMRIPHTAVAVYLERQELTRLDFIHQGCWVKNVMHVLRSSPAWRCLKLRLLQAQVKRFICKSGMLEQAGFLQDPYTLYLAINLLQDLGLEMSEAFRASALQSLAVPAQQSGVLSKTVSAILARRQLFGEIDHGGLAWLKAQQMEQGGFRASELTGESDMLSTAVALFTLRICGAMDEEITRPAKQFITDHWLPNGGFASLIDDERSDCEYTFYGLLGLGALAS